jgi:hypothetical protein
MCASVKAREPRSSLRSAYLTLEADALNTLHSCMDRSRTLIPQPHIFSHHQPPRALTGGCVLHSFLRPFILVTLHSLQVDFGKSSAHWAPQVDVSQLESRRLNPKPQGSRRARCTHFLSSQRCPSISLETRKDRVLDGRGAFQGCNLEAPPSGVLLGQEEWRGDYLF